MLDASVDPSKTTATAAQIPNAHFKDLRGDLAGECGELLKSIDGTHSPPSDVKKFYWIKKVLGTALGIRMSRPVGKRNLQ
jgi:hypothetical protein